MCYNKKVKEIYKCYFLRREFKMNGMGLDKETCQNVKKVASKYGYTVVCDEKEQELEDADLVLPASEQCESVKKVASKVGYTVVCDEEA